VAVFNVVIFIQLFFLLIETGGHLEAP